MSGAELIVFARRPVPGQAKTRLAAHCGPERAAQIAAELIRATVELAVAHWSGEVRLCGAPNARHPLFQELAARWPVPLADQAPGDLGEKMQAALRGGIARHGAAAVLGCDVPHCPPPVLWEAYERLNRGKNVLGPAEDGGYYLIGLTAPCPSLFEGIAWGSDTVLRETLARAAAAGVQFELLPMLRDIDTWDDLVQAAAHRPGLAALLQERHGAI